MGILCDPSGLEDILMMQKQALSDRRKRVFRHSGKLLKGVRAQYRAKESSKNKSTHLKGQ
jgi:hypothetical protein